MNHKSHIRSNQLRWAVAAFWLALAAPISAQQASGPPGDRTIPDREMQQERSRRELQLRNVGLEPKPESDKRSIKAVGEQIEQDFGRILLLHNQIVRAISSGQKLDYDFVAKAAEEIKKRASRLQSTLALREPPSQQENPEKPTVLEPSQLRASLLTLCKKIKSFVTNPVIETPGIVNVEQLGKARNDLEAIIKLGEQIKKDAEKLDKTQH